MLRPREFVTALLLRAAWDDASHLGGVKPIQMVAQCIANRVRLGWGSWHQVMFELPIYSAVSQAARIQPKLPEQNDPRFLLLLSSIDQIYDNSFEDLVGAGVFWADLNMISSAWFQTNVMRNREHARIAQSGTLVIWN